MKIPAPVELTRWRAGERNLSEGDKGYGEIQRKRLQGALRKELPFLNRMTEEILTERLAFDQKI